MHANTQKHKRIRTKLEIHKSDHLKTLTMQPKPDCHEICVVK